MVWLNIFLVVAAVFLIILDQIKSESRFRKTGISIAVVFMIGSAILTYAEHITKEEYERERQADLLTIQKLQSPLRDLCVELSLVSVDSSSSVDVVFQFNYNIRSTSSRSGLLGDHIRIGYSLDSGWFLAGTSFEFYSGLKLDINDDKTKLRFVLNDFGLSYSRKGNRTAWQPQNVADLFNMEIGLSSTVFNNKDYLREYYSEWCPIKRVIIYVNSYEKENILCVAERIPLPQDATTFAFHHFLPKSDPAFSNPDSRRFHTNLSMLRQSILSSLE